MLDILSSVNKKYTKGENNSDVVPVRPPKESSRAQPVPGVEGLAKMDNGEMRSYSCKKS